MRAYSPRLEGENYSTELQSLVAYCLERSPDSRPSIEQVQQHAFLKNTDLRYPTISLSHLIRAFKLWEHHGGKRKSLFMPGGAPGQHDSSSSWLEIDWNFSTTTAFDEDVHAHSSTQDVYDAYDTQVQIDISSNQKPHRSRRRPRRNAPPPLKVPLERIFDPNTVSNYEDNSRNHYTSSVQQHSDLPLQQVSVEKSVSRKTLVLQRNLEMDTRDLGGHDLETVRPNKLTENNRADTDLTRDWKFPTVPIATSSTEFGVLHLPVQTAQSRSSVVSLIDLDMSVPDPMPVLAQPSITRNEMMSLCSNSPESERYELTIQRAADIQKDPFPYDYDESLGLPTGHLESSVNKRSSFLET